MSQLNSFSLNNLDSCQLCPRHCTANRAQGQRGICGADNTLCVARAALHLWEEPPLVSGAGSGAVFFSNCSLRCVYCQNASIAHDGFGVSISTERLAEIFLELQQQGASNINLVTATHYIPWVIAALRKARLDGLNLPVVWNTSGFETIQAVEALAPFVDIWLCDFKYWRAEESSASALYSHAPRYFDIACAALDAMLRAAPHIVYEGDALLSGVIVRHLLLPGLLRDSKRLMSFLWHRYGNRVLYSVMNQYTPMKEFAFAPNLDACVSVQDYEELLSYLDSLGLQDYFWQEGSPVGESFIPAFDTTGVLHKDFDETIRSLSNKNGQT